MLVMLNSLLKQYIEEIGKIYGEHLKSVILYGSYARGDFRPESDIDIMIYWICQIWRFANIVNSFHGLRMIFMKNTILILNRLQRVKHIIKNG